MNSQQEQLFEEIMDQKISQEKFLYEGRDENGRWNLIAGLRNYRKYVRAYIDGFSGGRVSNSVFEIVLKEMLEASPRELRPIIVEDRSSEIEKKIADFEAGKIPVYSFRLACKADRELRDAYERFTGLAQLATGR